MTYHPIYVFCNQAYLRPLLSRRAYYKMACTFGNSAFTCSFFLFQLDRSVFVPAFMFLLNCI
jgi:hypothetical protein